MHCYSSEMVLPVAAALVPSKDGGQGSSIALGSLSRSLFTRLIPTTNRKMGYPHEVRLENAKKDRLGS